MNNLLREFSQLLNEEGLLYGELLDALKTERDALLKSDLEGFTCCMQAKQELLRRLQHLEQTRRDLQQGLAKHLGAAGKPFTMRRLVASLGTPLGTRFAEQRAWLKALLARVRDIQQTNRDLVAHGLKLTRGSLRFLEENLTPHRVYHPSGKIQKTTGSGRLLSGDA